ncbi:MAG TPA: hypothetical protein VF214_05820, partial [Edaphobacter sp.]
SALLGPSGQDAIVRSKLDYAFDQMRMQLGLPEAGRQSSREPVARESFVEPQQASNAEHDFEDNPAAIAQAAEESSVWSSVPPSATEEIPAYVESDEPNSVLSESEFGRPKPSEAEQPVTSFSLWAASLRSVQVPRQTGGGSGVEQSAVIEEGEPEAPTLKFAAEAHKTNLPILLAVLLGAAVAAGSVYLYWAGLLSRVNLSFVHPKTAAPAPQPEPAPPPAQAPVVAEPAPSVPPAPPRHEEADPKVWLEQWADAMRGRDAELQASFYADPVVRYLGDANVSREALTTFFRSQIQARNDLWTMKLERVSIDPVTSSHLIARLSKHVMELENSPAPAPDTNQNSAAANQVGAAAQITDRYVRSRLELRRTDGEWKIVSEQDVTPAGAAR